MMADEMFDAPFEMSFFVGFLESVNGAGHSHLVIALDTARHDWQNFGGSFDGVVTDFIWKKLGKEYRQMCAL